jgi:18S rRNA (guanine1575-N7)-methyltransferase
VLCLLEGLIVLEDTFPHAHRHSRHTSLHLIQNMSRPELTGHASLFYNEKEARKYNSSSRMINVQREITLRAIELLLLPPDQKSLVLDVGCGSGLSGRVLEQQGHVWVGCDVSRDMLKVAHERMEETFQMNEVDDDDDDNNNMKEDDDADRDDDESKDDDRPSTGDLMQHDMGTGLPFRPATFDACISISALQWLCYSNSAAQNPKRRLIRFFSSLYSVLKKSARAVLQFYPETAEQAVLISECATAVGFGGGIVVDYPNSAKAKKHYLVLSCDRTSKKQQLPQGLTGEEEQALAHVRVSKQQQDRKTKPIRKKKGIKTKEWILHKKESQRKKGKNVRPDSKYTARRRPAKF